MSEFELIVTEELDRRNWDELAVRSRYGTFFHKWGWLKSIEEGLNLTPRHLVVKKGGALIGIFPNFIERVEKVPIRRLSSLPIGYGGFIFSKNEDEILDLCLKKIEYIGKSETLLSHLIKTSNNEYICYNQKLGEYGYKMHIMQCKILVFINRSWSDVVKDFSQSRRNEIITANRTRIEIEDVLDLNTGLELFYQVYKKSMHDRFNLNPHTISLFLSFAKYIPNEMKLFIAKFDEQVAGAFIHFLDREKSTMYHYFGPVLEEYFSHNLPALLHEYSIKWGMENGYKYYDMGATAADISDRLFQYKKQFGGQVIPYLFWEKGFAKLKWNLFIVGRQLYRKCKG